MNNTPTEHLNLHSPALKIYLRMAQFKICVEEAVFKCWVKWANLPLDKVITDLLKVLYSFKSLCSVM